MADFEIGVVYRKGNRHFIAVNGTTLVSCQGGTSSVVRPTSSYDAVRSISVEDLCDKWDITLEHFDVLMAEHLAPPQTAIKTRPRGTRRKKEADDDYWRRHRTGRIARPKL